MNLHRFATLAALLAVLGAGSVRAQGEGPAAPGAGAALPGPGFTYQRHLTSGGAPVNGTCGFEFRLFDAVSGGAQLGGPQTVGGVSVSGGRFTVLLNGGGEFGPGAFNGQARWLAIAARCPDSGPHTPLTPRQALTPSPLAFALPGLRTEPNAASPHVIGGHISNTVSGGVFGATIGGGGSASGPNSVSASYGTVGGGSSNTASGDYTGVGAGRDNLASGFSAVVGGGAFNTASGHNAVVGGGSFNIAGGASDTVGGGQDNTAIGGFATVGGGADNYVSDTYTTIGGGQFNTASGTRATVGGGGTNAASANYATIGGGSSNTIFITGTAATVGGGTFNTASGLYATVPGGWDNTASGHYSFAAGRSARALHTGAFVWADSTNAVISTTTTNQFLVRASGGVTIYTDSDATMGVHVPPGGGSWTPVSDRNAKANFTAVDGVAVLEALMGVPIETWNYHTQDAAIRHMGPMAQDFYAAYGLGESDTGIGTVDADGVALAAIQGLYTLVQAQQAEIAALQAAQAEAAAPAPIASSAQLAVVLIGGLLAGAAIGAGAFGLGRRAARR